MSPLHFSLNEVQLCIDSDPSGLKLHRQTLLGPMLVSNDLWLIAGKSSQVSFCNWGSKLSLQSLLGFCFDWRLSLLKQREKGYTVVKFRNILIEKIVTTPRSRYRRFSGGQTTDGSEVRR